MTTKLSSKMLKKIIEEEASKFGKEQSPCDAAKDTDEVDADELADTLEKKIDYAKVLKVEEARLIRRVKKIRETRERIRKQVAKAL